VRERLHAGRADASRDLLHLLEPFVMMALDRLRPRAQIGEGMPVSRQHLADTRNLGDAVE
jgi:hypothetical protein